MFVARPYASLGAKNKTILILVTDILVQILSKTELTVKLLRMKGGNIISLRELDVSFIFLLAVVCLLPVPKTPHSFPRTKSHHPESLP